MNEKFSVYMIRIDMVFGMFFVVIVLEYLFVDKIIIKECY